VQTFEALPQLTARHAWQLALNSFEASFVPAADRARWAAQLEAAFEAQAHR
jgi:adenosine deaminase